MSKPIHAAQYRLTGPTAGMRMLRQVQGRQRWRLVVWLQHAPAPDAPPSSLKLDRDEHQINVDQLCQVTDLVPIYNAAIAELCAGTPTVTGGGFDAYLLPKHRQPQPTPMRRLALA